MITGTILDSNDNKIGVITGRRCAILRSVMLSNYLSVEMKN